MKGAHGISISSALCAVYLHDRAHQISVGRRDEIDGIFESLLLRVSLSRNHFKLEIKMSDTRTDKDRSLRIGETFV